MIFLDKWIFLSKVNRVVFFISPSPSLYLCLILCPFVSLTLSTYRDRDPRSLLPPPRSCGSLPRIIFVSLWLLTVAPSCSWLLTGVLTGVLPLSTFFHSWSHAWFSEKIVRICKFLVSPRWVPGEIWWAPGKLLVSSWWAPGKLLVSSWWESVSFLWVPSELLVRPRKSFIRSVWFVSNGREICNSIQFAIWFKQKQIDHWIDWQIGGWIKKNNWELLN